MSWTRSRMVAALLLAAGAGAVLLAVPGDRHAPDDTLQSDFAVCTAWAAGGLDEPPKPPPPPPPPPPPKPACNCSGWVAQGCQTGGCKQGDMFYTRTCSPASCGSTTKCSSSSSCPQPTCITGDWQYSACSSCGEGKRVRTRTVSPSGCAAASECISDPSCPIDPNKISGNWKPYGFALPGDPQYGFTYKGNEKQDFLALAAKGNVVIGDYTSAQFNANVLPALRPGAQSVTQPYAIDPTDAALGYHTGNKGVMYDAKGRPLFDGDYTTWDGGAKLDGKGRKFYESTLSDSAFKQLINPNDPLFKTSGKAKLDGVFYTNHAVAGAVNAEALNVNGALVSRDDALMFRKDLYLNHDTRLLDTSAVQLALPVSIKRPKLKSWSVCPASGCP